MNHGEIQSAITADCDRAGLWCWPSPAGAHYARPGWVDLVILGNTALFCEIKTAQGRRTRPQIECARRLTRAGLNYRLWREDDLRAGIVARELESLA